MLTDFRVKNAPVLAKLITLASLTGLMETLTGQGIAFDKMAADITLEKNILKVRDGRATGPSVGAKTGGIIDLKQHLFNMEGTLIPAYGVNKAISEIPVIGTILTAGGKQDLLAFNFTVKGPINEPNVMVNPLSALTPGIFREIFGASDGKNITSADQPKKTESRVGRDEP
jgi:uncharacterized protein YhdP